MSHDRGCHCGRERWEYDQCKDTNCTKSVQQRRIDVTNHYPNEQDAEANAQRYSRKSRKTVERSVSLDDNTMRSIKQLNSSVKYIWERAGSVQPAYVDQDDMLAITQRADYDPDMDRFYQVGNEVHVKISVEIKPKTVYRGSEDAKPRSAHTRSIAEQAGAAADNKLTVLKQALCSSEKMTVMRTDDHKQ
jgi:hypothetical protein